MNSKRTQISTTLSDLAVIPRNGIDDHVPEDTQDTDQVEAVVDMLDDLGIDVFDQAPDTDASPLKSQPPVDAVAEAAEAVLPPA